MADKSNALSKKTIIAIVAVIVLLFIASLSVGIFLADKCSTEVVDNNGAIANYYTAKKTGVTINNNVDEVGETTVKRVEEQERIVSREYWDWWTPNSVVAESASKVADQIVPTTPDLTVKKSAITGVGGDQFIYAGQEITYVIKVINNGTQDVNNIEITDKIPQNTNLVSVYDGGKEVIADNNTAVGVKWVISVPGHKEDEDAKFVTVRFTVKVNETMTVKDETGKMIEVPTTGIISNKAIANGKESGEVKTAIITNNKTSEITRYDKETDKYEVVETAKIGDRIKYTITVTNTGEAEGSTYIADIVPVGTKFVSAEDNAIISTSEDGKTNIIWSIKIGANSTITREFTVEVINIDGKITNIANVGGTDTNEEENQTANITVNKDVTDIKRIIDGVVTSIGKDAEVKTGDVIEYIIKVKNNGSRDLTNVVVDEKLVGIKLNAEDLTIGDLKAGEYREISATYSVTYETDIKNKEDRTILNEVYVSGETVPEPENPGETPTPVEDDDKVEIPVEETPAVNVVKTADKTECVKAGETINYTIVITNTGNMKLTNVPVSDDITIARGTVSLPVYSDEECTTEIKSIAKIEVGEVVTLYTKYTVEQADIDNQVTITNIATAMDTPSDPVPTTPEILNPALTVDKTATAVKVSSSEQYTTIDDTTKVRTGDVIEYTITVTNTGNKTLNNIEIKDNTLDVEFNGVNKSANTTITTIESLKPTDEPVEIKVYYTVTEPNCAKLPNIVNVATATADDGTSNNDNETVPVNIDTSVLVTKIWDDNENQDGIRPTTITINLLADGNIVKKETISGTEYKFEKLPTYNADGSTIIYTVSEDSVDGYTVTAITGSHANGYTITNTHTPETIDIPVTKVWEDNNNQDGIRPTSVEVNLKADNKATGKKVALSAINSWTDTFSNLPKYENGTEINYSVEENAIDGYTAAITGSTIAGYTVTNTHEPETINIPVTKVWDDNNNQDGKRTKLVNLSVMVGAEIIEEKTLSNANNWENTFTNLPKYKSGEEINYTVTESPIPGYTAVVTGSKETGFTVTNTHIPETTSVTVNKVWSDNGNQDGLRTNSVVVNLKSNDTSTGKTVTLSETNSWTDIFTDLPKYENGIQIRYTVEENAIDGYTAEVTGSDLGGFTITNTHIPETIDIPVTKVWNDNDNQDGKRTTSVVVNLKADNETTGKTVTLSNVNSWTDAFTNLPKYKNGTLINYTVEENAINGYIAEVTGSATEGYIVTNTHTPETIDIPVTKVWNDNDNQDGKRPESVSISLKANDVSTGKTVTLSETNSWIDTFTDLPKYENGTQISYTVEEDSISGYTAGVTGSATTGYTVTNTHTPETINIPVKKVWNDANNQDGKRPENVSISLKANDVSTEKTVTLSETNNWIDTFTTVPKYKDGTEISYTVEENNIQTGYTAEITGSKSTGFTVINSYTPETTSVTVNKVWDDANNQDGLRITSVEVILKANSENVGEPVVLSDSNSWAGTFNNLPKYANGQLISYTVEEKNVPRGYTQSISGDMTTGYTITNTHTPETIDIPVTKVWEDYDNHFDARKTITVDAKVGDIVKQTITISAGDNWTKSFTRLPKYSNGQEIMYTIVERPVEGYTLKGITGDQTNGYTITNTYNNVKINKKTLVSTDITEEKSKAKLDVVFVLDISGSMKNDKVKATDGTEITKAEAMVNATNKAMTEIMNTNSKNRIGVVMYSEDATKALELRSYSANNTIENDDTVGEFLKYSESGDEEDNKTYTIKTNVAGNDMTQVSKKVKGGTYTQLGIATGANMLKNANGTEGRTPVIILLTDGQPTFATTNYSNVTTSYNVGDGQESSTKGDRGYLTVLTANYYKKEVVASNYTEVPQMYTIGLGMNGDYAKTVLQPNTNNVNACKNANSRTSAKEIYNYLTGISTRIRDNTGSNVTVTNPYTDYNYADGSWSGEMDETKLKEILTEITQTINKHYQTTSTYTTNINKDVVKVELTNLDINEKIQISLDGVEAQEGGYTVAELTTSGVLIKEGGKYYIDLKANLFKDIKFIEITYCEVSSNT